MWSEADIWGWFSAAGDGCYVVNEECRIVLWNEMAQRLLGFTPEEALQRYCHELVQGQREEGLPLCQPDCAIREAASKGVSLPSYYLFARRKDGKGLWLNVSFLLIPPPPAQGKYIVHLLRNACQEKRALAYTEQVLSFIETHTRLVPDLWNAHPPDPQLLSRRETEILRLLAGGGDYKTIGWMLSISPYTVRNHIQNLSKKLGLHTRLELMIYAFKNHLFQGGSSDPPFLTGRFSSAKDEERPLTPAPEGLRTGGPGRASQKELQDAFSKAWSIEILRGGKMEEGVTA